MIRINLIILFTLFLTIKLEAQIQPSAYFVRYKVLIKKITSDDEYFTQNSNNPKYYENWIRQWEDLNTSLNADTTNFEAWVQYKNQTLVALALLRQLRLELHQPNRAERYYDFLSVADRMNLFEIQYYTDISISNANSAINNNLMNFRTRLSDQLDSLDSLSNLRLMAVNSAIERKVDSLVSMSNGPFFVGPSLYVENTYGFNFFIGHRALEDIFNFRSNRLSIMPEVLFFSNGLDRRYGGSLYFGYSIIPNKIIPQIMLQYLDDKRRIETTSSNNLNVGIGLLFKNREWMAGFAYSPVTGGGVKLLIGL